MIPSGTFRNADRLYTLIYEIHSFSFSATNSFWCACMQLECYHFARIALESRYYPSHYYCPISQNYYEMAIFLAYFLPRSQSDRREYRRFSLWWLMVWPIQPKDKLSQSHPRFGTQPRSCLESIRPTHSIIICLPSCSQLSYFPSVPKASTCPSCWLQYF